MPTPIEETWSIHNRINLFLLDAITQQQLPLTPSVKGRSVGQLFAHMHDVRLMWLKASAPELLEGLEKLGSDSHSKNDIAQALKNSGKAIEFLLGQAINADGRIKGFKPHASGFLGYLIAHEAHHRGQVALIMRQNGQPLDKKISYGMWEWGVR
jgi:uncharacterized damage-inducible protein DinB